MRSKFSIIGQIHLMTFLLFFLYFFTDCSDRKDPLPVSPPEITGLEEKYTLVEDGQLELSPVIVNGDNEVTYQWMLNGELTATTPTFLFQPEDPGEYQIQFYVTNEGGTATWELIVHVMAKSDPPVITRLEDEYIISVDSILQLQPSVVSADEVSYQWILDDEEVAVTETYQFQASDPGSYTLLLKATNAGGTTEQSISITVNPEPATLKSTTFKILDLSIPDYFNKENSLSWSVKESSSELYRFSVTDASTPRFVAVEPGEYILELSDGIIQGKITISVEDRSDPVSPYISKVYDYMPAPGQFVNELPPYEEGDDHDDMVRKANEWLVGEDTWMITLGGWGGSVTFGFDHTVVNVPGRRDFRIRGNAFGAAMGRPNAPFGGSCEPGIVMVAYDKNGNGKPDDDEWYEIKGSSNFSAEAEPWYDIAVENGNDTQVFRNYEMTYFKPEHEEPEIIGEPDNPLAFVTIQNYIRWEDNRNNSGYKVKNIYHSQSYYPAWIKEDRLTYTGIRLPENGINEGEYVPGINEGDVYYVLYGFRYGYVDNYPNVEDGSAIDIDWAIDKNGKKTDLPGIDFVKVYNGVNQENGWLGESSTEVDRGEDLHLLGKNISTIDID